MKTRQLIRKQKLTTDGNNTSATTTNPEGDQKQHSTQTQATGEREAVSVD